MLDAVWSGARGWLTPPVLFVFINIVIGTIAVMSKLMSSAGEGGNDGGGNQRRSLMRAPSVAFDRLRCFSFSSLGMSPDHHTAAAYAQQYPAFDDGAAAEAAAAASVYPAPDAGEWGRVSFLRRVPSVALDRLRGLSFSRRGALPADDHAPATPPSDSAADDAALCQAPAAVEKMEHEHEAGIERSRSEAAAEAPARRRARGKKTRMARTEERAADGHGIAAGTGRRELLLPPAVEVDARADDFIRQFREELRLQRLDSILRYKDTLRRTGTV